MAHPNKSSAAAGHTAKLRRMTKNYGAASGPENNIMSPQAKMKAEGPEESVNFGADSAKASARSDKPARRSAPANPIATYATGGAVARARGGRTKGATTVNVIIPPQGGQPDSGLGSSMSPQLAGLLPKPPMAPPMAGPPPGAPPMMPPPGSGGPPPGGMPMRAKGGRVKGELGGEGKFEYADDGDGDGSMGSIISDALKEEGLIRKARGGGVHMTAGAVTGIGRLEKMGITARHRGSMKPQDV